MITLAEAKAHLRMDHNADDVQIQAMIDAAESAILTYTGNGAYQDSDPLQPVRDDVKSACKLLVGDFYRYREPTPSDPMPENFGYGYLPRYVTALLFPYRKLVTA